MKTPVFTGSGVAIVTPFTEDFVDFVKLGDLIERQIAAGTEAIIVCGTTGEASTQTIPEHLATVEFAIKKAAGRVKVIAGTGSNDTAHAAMMSQNAEKSGADALLMVTPYYNKTTQRGLVRHYEYVADRVNIPIILYNIPARTGMGFTAESYKELAKHPNINGVKEASGNLDLINETRRICGDDFYIWSGDDSATVPIMAMGGVGVISTLANVLPKEMAELTKLCLDGRFRDAMALQTKLYELMKVLFIETNPIPVKTALNMMGIEVGHLRMPLCEMAPENEEKLRTVLKKYGLVQ